MVAGEVEGCREEGRGSRGEVEGMGGEGVTSEGREGDVGRTEEVEGKALPVEKVTKATQTDHIPEPMVVQVDDGTQTVLEELEKAMERKRERKRKGRAKDSENTVMKNESDISERSGSGQGSCCGTSGY